MTCNPNSIAVVPGCLNGSEPVSIHYEYTFDGSGIVTGLRRVMVTSGAGAPINLGPADYVAAGSCQQAIVVPVVGKDFELVSYDDSMVSPGNSCRKIILIASGDTPPEFSGFELDTSPISDFDANYIRPECPCSGNAPSIAW